MKNLLNIDDKVKVVLQGEGKENVIGNGEIVTICTIQKMGGEIYYTGEYHQNCPNGGEGYDTGIQFKEGEYENLDSKSLDQKDLSLLMGMVVKNSVELQAQLHDKNYESDLEKESLERELQSINEVGSKISAQINKK